MAQAKMYAITEEELKRIVSSVMEESNKGLADIVKEDHGRLGVIEKALDDLVKLITGNGTPQNGFIYKFTLVEQDVKRMAAGVWVIVAAVMGLAVAALWEILKTH